MRFLLSAVLGLTLALGVTPATGHEFWISPTAYQIQPGGEIKAHLRVGENFKGASYPYRDSQITRFDVVIDGKPTPYEGRIGDDPAFDMEAPDGLVVVVHETVDNTLSYTKFEKFEKFVAHKAFPDVIANHEVRGIGTERFVESYRRYAKALIAVGDGQGADAPTGLKTEIVALANPYTEKLTSLPVQVLLDGAPRADAQIELFEKSPDGSVDITLHRTDADGKGAVPVKPGHEYLVDAVWMEALPNDDPEAGPVWKSHWAALTFKMPE